MRIAGLQFDIAWEEPLRNFKRVAELAEQAVDQGAELLVLPEMFATAFSMDAKRVASHARETLDFLRQLAQKHQVAIVAGLAEEGRQRPANAAYAIGPDGATLASYRKMHPFSLAGEQEHFEAGDQLAVFEYAGTRIAIFICYDLRFPEPFRAVASSIDLYLVIANWPTRRSQAWRSLCQARAIENQAYLLGLNRVGLAEGVEHCGDSALIDPLGEILALKSGSEAIVSGEIDPSFVSSCRERFSFLLDRRPDLYLRLQGTQQETGE